MEQELQNKEVEGNPNTPEVTKEVTTPTSTEPSAVEQKAIEMGWRPKEEFDGDEADFITAEEFVRRKPLFDKIDTVGRELREAKKALKALQAHHAQVREAEYKRALEDLRTQKKEALREGNEDRLVEIDEQIAEIKAEEKITQREQAQQASAPHPAFVQWVESNKWYQSDAELRAVADQIGSAYAVANPDLHPDDVLAYTAKRVKKLYPEKFQNPNKSRPTVVEGGSSSVAVKPSSKAEDTFELTEDERRVMNTFVRNNLMTKEDYIAELKRVKGVK